MTSRGRVMGVLATLGVLAMGVALVGPLEKLLPNDFVWRPKPGAVYVLRGVAGEGANVRLLRVEEDELHRPRLLVRVLEGPRSGERGFVTRWQLRHLGAAPRLRLTPAAVISLALALAIGAVFWAFAIVLLEPAQRSKKRDSLLIKRYQ